MQLNYFVKVWKPVPYQFYPQNILRIYDSHFVPILTLHTDNSGTVMRKVRILTVRQFRNSHFAQSDSGIAQILTLRRTYIRQTSQSCLYSKKVLHDPHVNHNRCVSLSVRPSLLPLFVSENAHNSRTTWLITQM